MSIKKNATSVDVKDSLFVDEEPEVKKSYPSAPDADGFYFEDEYEEAQGIYTKVHENGSLVKKVILRNKKVAIIRELRGREMVEAQARGKKAREKSTEGQIVVANIAAAATMIDGEQLIIEDLFEMKCTDYAKIVAASTSVNLL